MKVDSAFREADFFFEGREVYIQWPDKYSTTLLRCTVHTPAGLHARVVNERRGVDEWRHRADVFVRVE